jgi:branched-chain amino acid transport system substrate-binding protein
MLETLQPSALKGNGVHGKKVKYVTGDTETKPDPARASARRMIERDGVIMFSGGSSSAVAVAQQYLAQEKGVIFMCALTHSNDTTARTAGATASATSSTRTCRARRWRRSWPSSTARTATPTT